MIKSILFSPIQLRLFHSCALALIAVHFVACESLTHPSLEPFAAYQLRPPAILKDDLHARFFGATTIQVDDGETSIMIDGFFSRPGLAQLIFLKIEPNKERITAGLARVPELAKKPKLAAVLVAHSHYDHAMDSAVVAKETGAVLLGTNSTANVGYGYPELPSPRIQISKHGEMWPFGRFSVQFLESPHSPDFLFPGEIAHPLKSPAYSASTAKDATIHSFFVILGARS